VTKPISWVSPCQNPELVGLPVQLLQRLPFHLQVSSGSTS